MKPLNAGGNRWQPERKKKVPMTASWAMGGGDHVQSRPFLANPTGRDEEKDILPILMLQPRPVPAFQGFIKEGGNMWVPVRTQDGYEGSVDVDPDRPITEQITDNWLSFGDDAKDTETNARRMTRFSIIPLGLVAVIAILGAFLLLGGQ